MIKGVTNLLNMVMVLKSEKGIGWGQVRRWKRKRGEEREELR